jgi:DNA polymerase IV
LERAALDQESLSLSTSPVALPQKDALDDAIIEVLKIDPATAFTNSSQDNSDDESSPPPSKVATDVPGWQQSFSCMHAHDGNETKENPNSKTIQVLGKMQAYYERTNDEWRAISYRKVISILKKTKEYVCTEQQAKAYIPSRELMLASPVLEIDSRKRLLRLVCILRVC